MKWTKQLSYRLLHPLWVADARRKVRLLRPWLSPGQSVLEIGCGPGTLLRELIACDYRVTSLDVEDQRIIPGLPAPIVYDGESMPFADKSFHAAILFTVLHHCPHPESVFREAARVAHHVAIVEDVYKSHAQRRLTQITDSIVNAEFRDHPHQQRTEAAWRDLFAREGWTVAGYQSWRLFWLYRQSFFWLSSTVPTPTSPLRQGSAPG